MSSPGSPGFLFENPTPYASTDNFTVRLFGIVGGDLPTVRFFVAGSTTPATTSAVGVVFVDSNFGDSARISQFDENDAPLGTFIAPTTANLGLSFLGVRFNAGDRIGRVVVQPGVGSFTDNNCGDCVVMDAFNYGEPTTIPEPSTFPLSADGVALALWIRRRQ